MAAYDPADLPALLRDRITVDERSGCWIWGGPLDRYGYGKHRGRGVHRLAWEILAGQVPPELVLDHRDDWGCTSRACCNPAHLKPVTHAENVLRGTSFSAVNARKTHCGNGHEFTKASTYRWRGRRDCRICGRSRVARYKRRLREAEAETLGRAA